MRKSSFVAGVLAATCLACRASASDTNYLPTRDTYMRGALTALHGSDATGRASKTNLDFYLTDFNRTAIRSSIEAELGHALTLADMPNVRLSLNLFSSDFEGYKPTALSRAAVFQGLQDWVEGTNTTTGATKGFAIYDPANSANNRPWKNNAGADVAEFSNLDRVENLNFEQWGGDPFTYRKWNLDNPVAFAYLTDPRSLGLFLNAFADPNEPDIDAQYSNTEIFSRETTNTSRLPFLEVVVVPEPALPSLMGLGALLLVRRRWRQVFCLTEFQPEGVAWFRTRNNSPTLIHS